MQRPIHKDKARQIIKIEIEGLGYIPICKKLAKQLIMDRKLICKQKPCAQKAIGFLRMNKGYKALCINCLDKIDYVVTTRISTEKYGGAFICNKYKNYINSLNLQQQYYMGLEFMKNHYNIFIQNHKKPEKQHYYQDYKNYHIHWSEF